MRRFLAALLLLLAAFSVGCGFMPDGVNVHVSDRGCLPSGLCPFGGVGPVNFYWVPSRTVVLAPNQSQRTLAHELCHAHQHLTVLVELGREPDVSLRDWGLTNEGRSFVAVAQDEGPVWSYQPSNEDPLEDFADTCALWLTDKGKLWRTAPARAAWAEEALR